MKADDIVSHPDYGVGRVRDVRRAGREANIEFHIGIVVLCATTELTLLGVSGISERTLRETAQQTPASSQDAQLTSTQPAAPIAPPKQPLDNAGVDDPDSLAVRPVEKNDNGTGQTGFTRQTLPPLSTPRAIPPDVGGMGQVIGPKTDVDEQFQSRQAIEALRLGVVPRFRINDLTVGLRHERETVEAAFDRTETYGGDVCAIVGEYGSGKSHFFEWTAMDALNRGYLVANASLDVYETPPSKPFRIYNSLVNSLRYPDRDDRGTLAGLFERIRDTVGIDAIRKSLSEFHDAWELCPLFDALRSYVRFTGEGDEERTRLILQWISGEKMPVWSLRNAKIFPCSPLRTFTTVADQYCYLLSGIAWLARQVGYKGLVVLVDESEHYSFLTTLMKERADVFFQGMIYSALGDRQTRVPLCRASHHGSLCGLKHGGTQPYPFAYSRGSGLLFMFAATTSTIALDYTSWLDPQKIIQLEGRLMPGEIEELLARIYVFHRKAFKYDRVADFAKTSSELIELYENGRVNLRELIRVSTEAFDLIYTYPEYTPQREA